MHILTALVIFMLLMTLMPDIKLILNICGLQVMLTLTISTRMGILMLLADLMLVNMLM